MRLHFTLVSICFALAACGGSSMPSKSTTAIPLNCNASLTQGTVPYSIQNDTLQLGTTTMPRVAAGTAGRPVYGTWLAAQQTNGGLSIRATFQVEPSAVTISALCSYSDGRSTTAQVSSPATITDTNITILQNKNVSVPFDETSGEDNPEGDVISE